MIEQLFESKKITPQEFKLYKLFACELGDEVLKELMIESFMEEPDEQFMTAGVLGFYDGRRSVIRAIKVTVEKVQTLINQQLSEVKNDG